MSQLSVPPEPWALGEMFSLNYLVVWGFKLIRLCVFLLFGICSAGKLEENFNGIVGHVFYYYLLLFLHHCFLLLILSYQDINKKLSK